MLFTPQTTLKKEMLWTVLPEVRRVSESCRSSSISLLKKYGHLTTRINVLCIYSSIYYESRELWIYACSC